MIWVLLVVVLEGEDTDWKGINLCGHLSPIQRKHHHKLRFFILYFMQQKRGIKRKETKSKI